MPADLYYVPGSGPCRLVLMVARELGVKLNLKFLNLMAGEQFKEDFVKINPQHCVPTYVEPDGVVLWESRAIVQYLCSKYAGPKSASLYPSDLATRARVDNMLHFDLGCLTKATIDYIFPKMFGGDYGPEDKREAFRKAVDLVDKFLEGKNWIAGTESYSLADLSIHATLGYTLIVPYDFTGHPNVVRWMGRLTAALPYNEEINTIPLNQFGEALKQAGRK